MILDPNNHWVKFRDCIPWDELPESYSCKEILGLWIAQIVTELKNRGVQDIFIACADGLTRIFHSVFPPATGDID